MSGRRLFRWLLRLLPFDFRADYGREIERSFLDQQRDAGSAAGRVRVWAENVRALATIGPREHVAQLRQDVGYALRMMRRDRGFVAVALLTLALGTGANTAIFSVVHAVLLAPLPYGEPSRVVSVMNRWDGQPRGGLSAPEYLDYEEGTAQLEIAALASGTTTISGGAGEPERLTAAIATTNLLDVLGRQPALGRGFRADESAAGTRVVIISNALWRSRFGADPSIIGRLIDLGTPHTVIGVLPPDLVLPVDIAEATPSAVIVPLALDPGAPRAIRGGHYLTGIGRLAPGASVDSARAEMEAVLARLSTHYPEEAMPKGLGILVRPLRDDLLGDSQPVLWTLSAAVMLVLLLACANVANLMLARGETRRRELAVRAALGASRFRMVRQLVTEALILSVAGTGLGLLVARWAHDVVLATGPTVLPRLSDVSLSVPVLLFAAALATLTTLLFGVLPAWHLSRANAGEALKDGVRGNASAGRTRVRTALVVGEVALAMILLVAAGLLIKSFARVMNVPSGLDTEQVLTARVTAPAARYPGLPEVSGFFTRLLERVRTLPGVEVAGAGSGLPFAVSSGDWGFDIEGRPRIDNRKPGRADWYVVTPGYFDALEIPIVAGRGPSESDTDGAPPVIFLNQSAATLLFPNGDAVGKRVKLSNTTGPEQPWRTIAGIVGDVRQGGLDEQVRTEMFLPYRQFQHFSANVQARAMTLVVRTAGEPAGVVAAVRGEVRALDPQIPLADVRPMTDVLARSVADRRLNMRLIGSFALLAIVLATVGVYGLIAYDVLQRTREIGIRLALGASRASVLSLVLTRGLRLVLAGAGAGLAAAALVTGQLSTLLFEVEPRDLTVFASVALLLATAGAVASYLPAWRATRVDPLSALRTE